MIPGKKFAVKRGSYVTFEDPVSGERMKGICSGFGHKDGNRIVFFDSGLWCYRFEIVDVSSIPYQDDIDWLVSEFANALECALEDVEPELFEKILSVIQKEINNHLDAQRKAFKDDEKASTQHEQEKTKARLPRRKRSRRR